jgi:hypothetical protein
MKSKGGAHREFPVVGCEGGSVGKNSFGTVMVVEKYWNPPLLCTCVCLGIVCGRECVWVQRVVYGGKQFQWVMVGGA